MPLLFFFCHILPVEKSNRGKLLCRLMLGRAYNLVSMRWLRAGGSAKA
jgi:hypothetical protein